MGSGPIFCIVPGAGGVVGQPPGFISGLGNGDISAPCQYASNAAGYISCKILKLLPALSVPFLNAIFIASDIPLTLPLITLTPYNKSPPLFIALSYSSA